MGSTDELGSLKCKGCDWEITNVPLEEAPRWVDAHLRQDHPTPDAATVLAEVRSKGFDAVLLGADANGPVMLGAWSISRPPCQLHRSNDCLPACDGRAL